MSSICRMRAQYGNSKQWYRSRSNEKVHACTRLQSREYRNELHQLERATAADTEFDVIRRMLKKQRANVVVVYLNIALITFGSNKFIVSNKRKTETENRRIRLRSLDQF